MRTILALALLLLPLPALAGSASTAPAGETVACVLEPVVSVSDRLWAPGKAELVGNGAKRKFHLLISVPSPGYRAEFGKPVLEKDELRWPLVLYPPEQEGFLERLELNEEIEIPPGAERLRVVLKKDFVWRPDAVVCPLTPPQK